MISGGSWGLSPTGWGVQFGFRVAASARLAGDANGDGRVDVNDLTIVLANFGYGVTAGAHRRRARTGGPVVAGRRPGRPAGVCLAETEVTSTPPRLGRVAAVVDGGRQPTLSSLEPLSRKRGQCLKKCPLALTTVSVCGVARLSVVLVACFVFWSVS
jgi:hypothetical protein